MSEALTALLAVSANKTQKIVSLSPESQAIFLYVSGLLESREFYIEGYTDEITDAEWDALDAMQAKASEEIMTGLTGEIVPTVTQVLKPGLLLCDGSVYQRVDYPDLYAAIDAIFIIDADRFHVPNIPAMTTLVSGVIGVTGGESEHTLTEAEIPAHSHSVNDTGHAHSEVSAIPTIINGGLEAPAPAATPTPAITGLAFTGVSINATGGNQPHTNMPPYFGVRFAIRT